eukprot:TRINITY_DN47270_c0_g1_i2.p1 TRINITY_DN47270_c0_g1~~TRINITY_DN47270_c0_g1_i2.p1  ORF type:complete len:369 (+),score=52.00 TRINITY_DN47270_c0_g1_i2:112-1218(+)
MSILRRRLCHGQFSKLPAGHLARRHSRLGRLRRFAAAARCKASTKMMSLEHSKAFAAVQPVSWREKTAPQERALADAMERFLVLLRCTETAPEDLVALSDQLVDAGHQYRFVLSAAISAGGASKPTGKHLAKSDVEVIDLGDDKRPPSKADANALALRAERLDSALCPILAAEHPDEVLCSCSGIPLTRRSFSCLAPGAWLSDEVVNCYMRLLQERPGGPRRWCPSSFFWPSLLDKGPAGVRRWTVRAKVNVSELELVVVPLNVMEGSHWAVAAVSPSGARPGVYYLDSLGVRPPEALVSSLQAWFAEVSGTVVSRPWTLLKGSRVSRQDNSYDCGLYALRFAERLIEGAPLPEAGVVDDCDFVDYRR